MPVPNTINDLSTTADSNYPQGTEAALPQMDNYMRAFAAFIAQNRDSIAGLSSTKQDKAGTFPYAQLTGVPAAQSRWDTGEWVLSAKTTAPAGTVNPNGGTIGSAASGATNRANADTADLFALLWAVTSNTDYPIQDSAGAASTRGASATADFAANKRMPLPNIQDGDALVAAVSSAVLSRTVGEVISHSHTATVTDPGHSHSFYDVRSAGGGGYLGGGDQDWSRYTNPAFTGVTVSISSTGGTKNKAAGLMTRIYIAL